MYMVDSDLEAPGDPAAHPEKETTMSTADIHAEHTVADHEHGTSCGHEAVAHDDHVDYVHDGHKHALHDGHYDEH